MGREATPGLGWDGDFCAIRVEFWPGSVAWDPRRSGTPGCESGLVRRARRVFS